VTLFTDSGSRLCWFTLWPWKFAIDIDIGFSLYHYASLDMLSLCTTVSRVGFKSRAYTYSVSYKKSAKLCIHSCILWFLHAKAATASARLSHRNSVHPSVCPFICLSHKWISQKRCKLGSPNLHGRLPGRL